MAAASAPWSLKPAWRRWVELACPVAAEPIELPHKESAGAGNPWRGQEAVLQPPSASIPSKDVTVP